MVQAEAPGIHKVTQEEATKIFIISISNWRQNLKKNQNKTDKKEIGNI